MKLTGRINAPKACSYVSGPLLTVIKQHNGQNFNIKEVC